MADMKFHSTDHGFCRVYYKRGRNLFCLQDEGGHCGVLLYACTSEGEPSHQVKTTGLTFEPIPDPDLNDQPFMYFLETNGLLEVAA